MPAKLRFVLSFLGAFISASCLGGDSGTAADRLATAIGKAHSVDFYFVSRTEEYVLRGQGFKAASSIRIHRECGANCKHFMDRVIVHLRQSAPTRCQPGQEDVLIEPDHGPSLLYSYSGRVIEFEGKCYLNRKGIQAVIQNADFLFD